MPRIAHPYQSLIDQVVSEYPGIDALVFEAMISVESGFNPNARSASGAIGLGQIIARWHGPLIQRVAEAQAFTGNVEQALFDPGVNLRVAAAYLMDCHRACGDWIKAVRRYHSGKCDPPDDFVDGQGTSSDAHITKLRAAIERFRETEDTGMSTAVYSTTIPGCPGGPLQTSFPVVVDLVPSSMTRNRPGIKLRGTFDTTQHMTANRKTKARAEANYLINGAGGRQASWHNTVDDVIGIVTIPWDEVGWHATDGSGPGNMSTLSCELVEQQALLDDPVKWRRARRNAAELMGKAAARKGGDRNPKFHKDWYPVKGCPRVLLSNPTWMAEYRADYITFYEMERAAMAGTTPPKDEVINIGDTIRALVNLNLRSAATTKAPIIVTLEKGDNATVNGRYVSADGYGWLPVETSSGSGFVAMGDSSGPYLEKADSTPPPTPAPTYVPVRPIPALLATDLQKYDTAEGITTDDSGNEFIFTADVIEFTTLTVAGEFAVPNPRPAKAPYQEKDRAIGAWLVKAKDEAGWGSEEERWHYILAGEGDEWVRVPYVNTIRVSDAPLLGDDNV